VATAVGNDGGKSSSYRAEHRFGNQMFNWLLGAKFGVRPADMFSGHRAFSRRFVKSLPADVRGFEIETELMVHALDLRVPTGKLRPPYFARQEGSASKPNKWRDGFRILSAMAQLFRDVRPLPFFATMASLLAIASLTLGSCVVVEYIHTSLVPRLPTALPATGSMLLASLSLTCCVNLDSVAHGRHAAMRLVYLALDRAFAKQSKSTRL
jgi:hypothetical protein